MQVIINPMPATAYSITFIKKKMTAASNAIPPSAPNIKRNISSMVSVFFCSATKIRNVFQTRKYFL